MTAASNYLENKVLDHVLKYSTAPYVAPTTLYVALFTATTGLETNAPTAEVLVGSVGTATGYVRQTIAFNSASSGSSANTSTVTFPTATYDYGTITHVAIVDHVSNTTWGSNVNVLWHGAVTTTKTIGTGDTFSISSGNLTVSLD